MIPKKVIKRDGTTVEYDETKIIEAIFAAAKAVGGHDYELAQNTGHAFFKEFIINKFPDKPGRYPLHTGREDLALNTARNIISYIRRNILLPDKHGRYFALIPGDKLRTRSFFLSS